MEDPQGAIVDIFPLDRYLTFPANVLIWDTTGLLFFTTDGQWLKSFCIPQNMRGNTIRSALWERLTEEQLNCLARRY